jgi:hypothetical protein
MFRMALAIIVLTAAIAVAGGSAHSGSAGAAITGVPDIPCPSGQRTSDGRCCVDHDCRSTWPPRPPSAPGCVTGTERMGLTRGRSAAVHASQLDTPPLIGPFGAAATNGRFAVSTAQGLIAFYPRGNRGRSRPIVQPTDAGAGAYFIPGFNKAGRYHWHIVLGAGERVRRSRRGAVIVDDAGHRLVLLRVRRFSAASLLPLSARHSVRSAQTAEEPPSAGPEPDGDGVYADYPGTGFEQLEAVPYGEPDPLSCSEVSTPGTANAPPPGPEDSEVVIPFDSPLPINPRRDASAHPAFVVGYCTLIVFRPFHVGVAAGFFGWEYARATLGCDAPVRAIVKTTTVKISKSIGGRFVGRRTHHRISLGGATTLTQARTVCRNTNNHRWRASARATIVARTFPYIGSTAGRAYGYDDCG